MAVQGVTAKIVSVLGNKESLIPIMIKDGADSASLTYHAYKAGGAVEGQDRAIDEFGTQAVWIGGIPFYKKIIDASVYKPAELHPDADIRVVSNPEYALWAQKNAKGMMPQDGFLSRLKFLQPKEESVKSALSKAMKDGGEKVKNLYRFKVIAAAALTLGTFFTLTKYKQKKTKNNVLSEIKKEKKNKPLLNSKASPSFKGLKEAADAVMFNPIHNMQIIDAGITAERISCSRNKTELAEHAIKEGGFLFFLYCFGGMIENSFNKFCSSKIGIPIDNCIDVLNSGKFKDALKKGTVISDITKLPKNGSLTDKLNFIINNPGNILVNAAKKSKIVSETKDAAGNLFVDTSKYIDMKKLDELSQNLKTAAEKFAKSGMSADKFLSKAAGLKTAASILNIVSSCLFLGYLIPKAVYKYRELKTGTREFHAALNIKKEASV